MESLEGARLLLLVLLNPLLLLFTSAASGTPGGSSTSGSASSAAGRLGAAGGCLCIHVHSVGDVELLFRLVLQCIAGNGLEGLVDVEILLRAAKATRQQQGK